MEHAILSSGAALASPEVFCGFTKILAKLPTETKGCEEAMVAPERQRALRDVLDVCEGCYGWEHFLLTPYLELSTAHPGLLLV